MERNEIETQLDLLAKIMLLKGLRAPTIELRFRSNTYPAMYIKWEDDISDYQNKWIYEDNVFLCLEAAQNFINELPSIRERQEKAFTEQIGTAINMARNLGLEFNYVKPLEELMKKLSNNALEMDTRNLLSLDES